MDDLDRADRRRLLRLRWPEMPDEQFEAICQIWEGGVKFAKREKHQAAKQAREKPERWTPQEYSVTELRDLLSPGKGPGL